ncbi:response regulator transcription factor [Sanguibacter antarcticus]|uniref:Two-component system phosphate regulon response regulator PhoB n=1 Tax=Sanguibacter antarcticus TaxID=372484 RepID=A0A2A9E476_9MICO|nr:response regulator [Sanguibacter antarcticus]PFG33654.1 two-component system phosphate regulon response regulator PhoB [Sanguibacter antarcticus]
MASQDRVLVVDDNHDICDLVALKLTNSGFGVSQAFDGATALQTARAEAFDLIILDVMMPGMSGLDVLRALRDEAATRSTPVLMLTAKTQERDIEAGFAAGADDYITKPFSPRELLVRVRVILRRGQQ